MCSPYCQQSCPPCNGPPCNSPYCPSPCCNATPCSNLQPLTACCPTYSTCEPCIPQPQLRRHPHAHCRHPCGFKGIPPDRRCVLQCIANDGCRTRTCHFYSTRPPCCFYNPSSPIQNPNRFTQHMARQRPVHARLADDTTDLDSGAHSRRHRDSSNLRHRHRQRFNAERGCHRAAHCGHQSADETDVASRDHRPSPLSRNRAPREKVAGGVAGGAASPTVPVLEETTDQEATAPASQPEPL